MSGTNNPTTTTSTGTTAPTSGQTATGSSAPSATATATANATAINDLTFFINGATVSTTPPGGGTTSGGTTITGNNNIVGDNNTLTSATTTGSNGSTTTATTHNSAETSTFSGSNVTNLRQGLRSGTAVTLVGSGESVTFTPPTGHMGNGEVERAMTLASRDLRDAGITNPTPEQFQTALMGGTVTNAQGQTTSMDGVLTLRSQGMGWGQVAQTIGVHPSQSEQGAANSRRGGSNSAGSFASRHSERSAHALSASSERNQLSHEGTQATAISSSSAIANASIGDRDRDARQARDSRSTDRSSDLARIDTRINSRIGDSPGDRGHSLQTKDRNDARSVASIGGGDRMGRDKSHSNASAAGAVSTESAFNGPAQAGPGNRSHASTNAKSGLGTGGSNRDHGLHGPSGSTDGSFSASAGGELGGGGTGKGHGGGKGK